jgi:hypothetical protein
MNRVGSILAACALALLVASCGGGGDAATGTTATSTASEPLLGSPGPLRMATPQALASAQPFTTATLFDWGQQNFPQFFGGSGIDGVVGPFSYRFYTQTQTFLAVSSDDGGVYVKGPVSGNQLVFLAPLSLLTCATNPGACPAVAVGGSATGTVSSVGDRDWHTVSLSAGQAYSFRLEGAANGQGTLPDPVLRLFNSAGRQLTSDDDSGVGFNSSMVCAPPASGTFYLSAEGTTTDTGTYRLSVSPVPGAAVACDTRANDPGINWNSPVSAPGIILGAVTLGAQQRGSVPFDVTGGDLPIELTFASQGAADLYVVNSADAAGCVAGGAFNFIAPASFERQSGWRSFILAPGSYALCARNQTSLPNTVRIDLQRQTAAPGFHFSRQQFAPVAQTVAAGARVVQPVSASDLFRIFIDGANTGGIFYIIPPEETQNFLAGQAFQHYPDLTAACGGLGAAGTAAPSLCELPGVAQYSIAYVNNTASPQSIVVTGREYVPD